MSVTYDDFHGSPEAKIVSDKTTKTLGHNDVFIETLLTGLYGKRRAFLKTGQVREHERVGWDQYCRKRKRYGYQDFANGSFSHRAVWDANCVYPVPIDSILPTQHPLMFASAIVWAILSEFGVRPTDLAMEFGVSEYHVFRSGGPRPEDLKSINIYPLTATFEPSGIPTLEFVFKGVHAQGSLVGCRESIRKRCKLLREGSVRYRGVLIL
ncbi:hypothetical protein BDV29DRAFT_195375 [Aspergillus leporis]|uniref:Uncharacterized protein n=1 Tax=Aspergillus leporis TaxID=41062 RepID=A0A5N5WJW0_9EURO|nr:hypothetical protein BDV29DRAFT_195375 [Aspergillus leporis]